MIEVIDSFGGKYEFLSNFSNHKVILFGGEYSTSEHAFQAMKTTTERDFEYIRSAPTPAQAKWRGNRITICKNWRRQRDSAMALVVFSKFTRDTDIARELISTGDAELIEGNYHGDDYWGKIKDGSGDWVGQNKLGEVLMSVRELLLGAEAFLSA